MYTYVRGPDIEVEAVLVLAGKSAHAGYEQAEGLWADGLETSSKQRPLPPRVSLWGLNIYNMIYTIKHQVQSERGTQTSHLRRPITVKKGVGL